MNCAAHPECGAWEYWLPVMLDGLAGLDCSVSGSAGRWRVWRVRAREEFYSRKADAFAAAESSAPGKDRK